MLCLLGTYVCWMLQRVQSSKSGPYCEDVTAKWRWQKLLTHMEQQQTIQVSISVGVEICGEDKKKSGKKRETITVVWDSGWEEVAISSECTWAWGEKEPREGNRKPSSWSYVGKGRLGSWKLGKRT